mgnify:FL=1
MQKINKIFLTLFVFIFMNSLYGQKKKSMVEIYDLKTSFVDTKSNYKSFFTVTESLIFKDGSTISIGDTLKLGPSSNKTSNNYEKIASGRTSIGSVPIPKSSLVNTSAQNFDWILEKIMVTRFLGDLDVEMYIRNPDAKGLASYKYLTISDDSFLNGEVINPNKLMTREEAIAKLKEAKDLMDLGLISEDEFKALRSELQPLIMGNN